MPFSVLKGSLNFPQCDMRILESSCCALISVIIWSGIPLLLRACQILLRSMASNNFSKSIKERCVELYSLHCSIIKRRLFIWSTHEPFAPTGLLLPVVVRLGCCEFGSTLKNLQTAVVRDISFQFPQSLRSPFLEILIIKLPLQSFGTVSAGNWLFARKFASYMADSFKLTNLVKHRI